MENVPSGLKVQTVSLDIPPGQVTYPAHLPTTPAGPTDALCALTTGASIAPSSSANATIPTIFAPSNRVGLMRPSFRPSDAFGSTVVTSAGTESNSAASFRQERDSEAPHGT